ncbi:MAG: TRAP transporter TatT component family protein, partial [Woeseia sp.]
ISMLHHAPTLRSLLVVAALLQSGCASLVSSAASGFADNLSLAVLNQTDPETVRDGAPAYLLLLDSLIEGNPDDPALLAAAADLYASYGAVFAEDAVRAARLTERARRYASKAICIEYAPSCTWNDMDYEAYERSLEGLAEKHADVVLSYAVASLSYIRAHSDDWTSLARLPHMEALLLRYLDVSDGTDDSDAYTYLGILTTLRPPALGGEPEKGRAYFERSIELSGGRDLGAKVEFARGYARLMYDQELHDRLLQEVLAAEAEVPGYTLTNVLAQRDARVLLESGADYF